MLTRSQNFDTAIFSSSGLFYTEGIKFMTIWYVDMC